MSLSRSSSNASLRSDSSQFSSTTLSSTMSRCLFEPPHVSKREYLLAQIRHKDQIIESLLKQLHNPYVATPLSISAFQMATSPSDKDNVRIVDWMDRLQSSTRPPTQPCPSRMKMLHELRDPHGSSGGAVDTIMDDSDDTDDVDETTEGEDTENMRSTLPDAAVPIGLLANLSLDKDVDKGKSKSRQGSGSGSTRTKPADGDENVGVANKEYFMPGPANNLSIRKNLIEKHSPPDIVLHGLVTADDVEKLFEIFWNDINPFISLLDRKLHSPSTIFQRCPFLFTVICAVSSRYYNAKSDIYPVAMHFAKHSAANALTDGWKSLELCQAYILLSIYTVPARKWEEDRSWLYTGLAIRIATDLNLHQVPSLQSLTERQEREILNRTRVWMICFNLDRSTATQFGKQSTIKEDYIIRNSADWYKKSQYRDKYDLHLCAYTALLRIVAQFHDNIFSDPDSPTGLNKSIDFLAVTSKHDDHLTSYSEEWTRRFHEESDRTDPGSDFRCTLLPFLVNYSRLVMYSFGFQHAFQRGMEASDHVFLKKCFESATKVIKHMIEVLAPTGYMRSSPDGHFIFASFASAFLLKLLRPEFAQLLTREMEDEIFDLIGRLITTLQDLAIDERHTPHLYARFLASLLTKHRKGGAGVGGHTRPQPPTSQLVHQSGQPHGYLGPQHTPSSRMQYSGSSSKDSSQPRYDNDTMQMNPGPLPSTSRTPPPTTTTPMPITNTPPPDFVHSQSSFPLVSGSVDPVTTDTVIDDMLSEVGSLATMYVLNDAWWGNMMMPGFTWSDAPEMSNVDDGPHAGVPNTYYPGFTGFLAPETQVVM
ncbi:fungal-specific transcription factor domain-containing protein [Scleroderma yunnanense]